MTGVIPAIPRIRFNDAAGNPISGGSVTVYLAGSTTLAVTYQDKALTVTNQNPVPLDSHGECLLWVDSSKTYKLLLKDAGGVPVSGWPVDDIPGAADIGSAATAAAAAAQPYADAAAVSATTASTKATEASSYAAAAATGAKFFDTLALGNAGVADGATFGVKSGGSDNFSRPRVYRRDSAGVSTFLYEALPGAEFDTMKVSLSSVTQTIGAASPVTGSSVSNQAVLWNDPITKSGFLDSITLYVLATGALKIATFSISGSTATRTAEASVTLASTGLVTLTSADFGVFPVKAGENLGLYAFPAQFAFIGATADGTGWRGGTYGATVALGATQTTFRLQANFKVTTQTVTASALTPLSGGGTLSLSNVDKILLCSNSYGAAAATLVGKAPIATASSLSEYNWANFSQGGASILTLLGRTTDGTVIWGSTFPAHKPTHVIISENQNSHLGLTDAQYFDYYQKMIDIVRGIGAAPIIMTEWGVGQNIGGASVATFDGEQRSVKGLRALAEANRCPFIDGTSKSRTMNPTGYDPFWKSAHPATRTSHLISDALRKTSAILPRPLRSMKIFRVRGTVTVSTVADLAYRTVQERHRLFREIYVGQSALDETLKNHYDDNTAISTTQEVNDEYVSLNSGNATSLGNYALIDCVLPSSGATGVTLTLSDTTCTVYARQMLTAGPTWVQLGLGGGKFIVPDGQSLVDNSRISFLVFKGGGISLNASPVVAWSAGTPRLPATPEKLYPPRGAEMLTQPLTVVSGAVPAQWTNAGTLPAVTPIDAITPTGTTGCVEVTSANGISQSMAYSSSDDPTEVVIRVWARRWVSVFVSTDSFATAPVTYETCDTATLKVTLHGATGITTASATMIEQVGLHWGEFEFRATLPGGTTATNVDVRSNDTPIQIAKVSVRAA